MTNIKNNNKKILGYAALIVLGILMQIGAAYLLNGILLGLPGLANVEEEYSVTNDYLTSMEPRMVVWVMLAAPILEELVFRAGLMGFSLKLWDSFAKADFKKKAENHDRFAIDNDNRNAIQKKLDNTKQIKRFWIINAIVSLLFGMYHGNLVQGVYGFLLGLLLGYIYIYAGGIFGSLFFHISINTAGLYIMPYVPQLTPSIIMLIPGIIIVALVYLIVFKICSKMF